MAAGQEHVRRARARPRRGRTPRRRRRKRRRRGHMARTGPRRWCQWWSRRHLVTSDGPRCHAQLRRFATREKCPREMPERNEWWTWRSSSASCANVWLRSTPTSPAVERGASSLTYAGTLAGDDPAGRREGRTRQACHRFATATCCATRGCCGLASNRGAGSRGAVGGRRRPARRAPAVRHVRSSRAPRSSRSSTSTATRTTHSWPSGCAAARTMAALHELEPEQLGLTGEPLVGPGEEIDRWSRLLETVDPALGARLGGGRRCAARRRATRPPGGVGARRLPAREHALGREHTSRPSSTGRSGRWAIRASISAGSSRTPIRRPTAARPRTSAAFPRSRSLSAVYVDALRPRRRRSRVVPGARVLQVGRDVVG